jgi:hypothetical protein
MALGTISVCLTVMVLNFHHRDCEQPVPDWARIFILGHLAHILRITPRSSGSECLVDVTSESQASTCPILFRSIDARDISPQIVVSVILNASQNVDLMIDQLPAGIK